MTHQQLNPENWVKLLESKCKRDASKFNVNVIRHIYYQTRNVI
jgi:hypothetical protein